MVKPGRNHVSFNYYLNNHLLQRVNSVKDVGILFDHRLTFNMHVSQLIKKNVNKALGIIQSLKKIFNLYRMIIFFAAENSTLIHTFG